MSKVTAAQRPDADFSTWVTPENMVKAAIFLAQQDARGMSGAAVTDEEIVRRLGLVRALGDFGFTPTEQELQHQVRRSTTLYCRCVSHWTSLAGGV